MRWKKSLPVVAAAAGNVIWGLSFLFIQTALGHAQSQVLLAHRFLLASVGVGSFMLCTGRRLTLRGKNWKPLMLILVGIHLLTRSRSKAPS